MCTLVCWAEMLHQSWPETLTSTFSFHRCCFILRSLFYLHRKSTALQNLTPPHPLLPLVPNHGFELRPGSFWVHCWKMDHAFSGVLEILIFEDPILQSTQACGDNLKAMTNFIADACGTMDIALTPLNHHRCSELAAVFGCKQCTGKLSWCTVSICRQTVSL